MSKKSKFVREERIKRQRSQEGLENRAALREIMKMVRQHVKRLMLLRSSKASCQ